MDELEFLNRLDELPINEWESLRLDGTLIEEELDDITLYRIKKRTKDKVLLKSNQNSLKQKKNRILHARNVLIATFLILLLPMTAVAFSSMYHYLPELGGLIESKQIVFQLNEKQELDTVKGLATLDGFVLVNNERAYTSVTVQSKELGIVSDTAILWINEVPYLSNSFSVGGGDELVFHHEFRNLPSFNAEEVILYEWQLATGEPYTFEIRLRESDAKGSYDSLGPTSEKEKISITAIVNEAPNLLTVDFLSPNQEVVEYGTSMCIDEKQNCGVYLVDSKGTRVDGNRIFYHDRSNQFSFETDGLVKPYRVVVEKVVTHHTQEHYQFTLNLPKFHERLVNVKPLLLGDFKVEIDSMSLVEGQKDELGNWLNAGESYLLELKVRLNSTSALNQRLLSFKLQSNSLKLPYISPSFNGYGAIYNENGEYEEILIGLTRTYATLPIVINNLEIEVSGNWEFFIE